MLERGYGTPPQTPPSALQPPIVRSRMEKSKVGNPTTDMLTKN